MVEPQFSIEVNFGGEKTLPVAWGGLICPWYV